MECDLLDIVYSCKKNQHKYKNTVIYVISCKNQLVKDVYIGHTTDFYNRKQSHMNECKTNHRKVYEFIRSNGGWSNWDMSILGEYTCKTRGHACRLEWIWWNRIGRGSLNAIIPGSNYIKRDKAKHIDFDTYIHDMELSCIIRN
jgi:predicted GIY-YIG superfamily endonuclease